MQRSQIFILVLGLIMSSCYFVDDIFDPPKEKEPSLQERSQEAVSKYLNKSVSGTYTSFGFGGIVIRKPVEIVQLENMEAKAKTSDDPELDSAIADKRRFIIENNIERTIDIDHFFTVKDSLGRLKVFETNFILNDTLGVKDLSASIMINLPEDYVEALNYYFYEYNIFMSDSYYESRNLSSNFYAFFKAELERRNGREEKSAFLLHVIKLTHQVKAKGEFEQERILEENVQAYIKVNRKDIEQYRSLRFSDLYQTIEEEQNEVSGYYFFHKFIGSFEDKLDTNVVLVEFTPYYEIDGIYQMERPFEKYFNN